jgi:RNA polymerase sigma-70 factor (ECF subfamily)
LLRKEHPSDADLVRRFRAGEARAFEALVDRYKRPLFVLLARLVGDRDAADDLLQESFVRLWRHMDTLDVSEPLFGLLRRTAVNLGLNHMRGRARRRDAMDSLGRELSCAPAAAGGTGGDDASDETSLAVREALDEIPAEQRTCLVLRVQEEMSYAEIARSTGVAVGTVMSRLSRARASLREKLKQRAVL